MRVQFVISGLGLGGAERQVVLLSKEFARRGHAVSIYTLNRLVKRADELAGTAVELVVDQKASRLDLAAILRLRRHLQTWQPDVVHSFLYDADIYARLAAIGLGLPILNSERSDNYVPSMLQRLGYRITRMLADGVVANSYSGAAFASRLHGLPEACVHVVWNGIDLAEVDARLARPAQPAHEIWPGQDLKRACIVGSIGPAKDYLLMLRVARRAIDLDPRWRFICVGDSLPASGDGYKAGVLQEVQRLRLADHVRFVGHRRDVPEVMASCEAVLVTSAREGFPNVVLEAMACGTPVASTDYSDVRRILPFGWQVVGSRCEVELAAALNRCVDERALVGASERAWVERHATVAASADAMLAVYAGHVRPVESLKRAAT